MFATVFPDVGPKNLRDACVVLFAEEEQQTSVLTSRVNVGNRLANLWSDRSTGCRRYLGGRRRYFFERSCTGSWTMRPQTLRTSRERRRRAYTRFRRIGGRRAKIGWLALIRLAFFFSSQHFISNSEERLASVLRDSKSRANKKVSLTDRRYAFRAECRFIAISTRALGCQAGGSEEHGFASLESHNLQMRS
jgi:hypothetical protein